MLNRLDELEKTQKAKITEEDVRTILKDKLDPLTQDLLEIRELINKILDLHLKNN